MKLKLIKEVFAGRHTVRGLSKESRIPRFLLRKWLDQYQLSGREGLLPRKKQTYSREFKLKVIETYYRKKLTLRDCCLRYDIPSQSTLISWLGKYEQLGSESLCKKRGRPKSMKKDKPSKKDSSPCTRLEELEKENLYLIAENEYLKKLEALAQKETPRKKRR